MLFLLVCLHCTLFTRYSGMQTDRRYGGLNADRKGTSRGSWATVISSSTGLAEITSLPPFIQKYLLHNSFTSFAGCPFPLFSFFLCVTLFSWPCSAQMCKSDKKNKTNPPKKEDYLFLLGPAAAARWCHGRLACVSRPIPLLRSLTPRLGRCRLPGGLREDPEVHLLFIMACVSVFTAPVTMAGVLDASATGYINAERSFLVSWRRRLSYHHCNASHWQDLFRIHLSFGLQF